MATLAFSVNNPLDSAAKAAIKLQNMLPQLETQYGHLIQDLRQTWEGSTNAFSFKAKGYEIIGVLYIEDATIDIEAEVPWAVTLMAGKIETMFRQKMLELLNS